MDRRALILPAALALAPATAAADPVSLVAVAFAALSAAVPAGGVTIAGIAISAGIATAAIGVAGALATTLLGVALAPDARRPRQPDVKRQLAQANALTPYRFCYGRTRVFASPIALVDDADAGKLYICALVNSRPSEGPFTLWLDRREVVLSGDPYSDTGAIADNDAFRDSELDGQSMAAVWFRRGDQTAPPSRFLTERPDVFAATDAGAGLTLVWMILGRGRRSTELDRWPAWPPQIEVEGDFSRVWDPRDPAQDADDPDTWTYSDNRALCVLDALRRNPVRPYPLAQIDVDLFRAVADSDDEAVALKAGGTEPRYRVAGVLVWSDAELEDQVAPLALAGAGELVRIGGRVGLTPGVAVDPSYTLTDALDDDGLLYEIWRPGRELATTLQAGYVRADAGYEEASFVYAVPGAREADGGVETVASVDLSFAASATQVQRVAKILGFRQRAQRRLTLVAPPSAIVCAAGGVATVAFPSPWDPMNGRYRVMSAAPTLIEAQDPAGGRAQGVTGRVPLTLAEDFLEAYAWDAATEEVAPGEVPAVTVETPPLPAPGAIAFATGDDAALDTGDAILPRIRFSWAPAESERVIAYEVQARPVGGDYTSITSVNGEVRDNLGDVFMFLDEVQAGSSYDLRVRSVGAGSVSEWIEAAGVTAEGPDVTLSAPGSPSATGGAGQIAVSFTAPNDANFRAINFYAAATNDTGAATLLAGPINGVANATYSVTETGLGSSETRFYWARSVGPFGALSAFSAAATATTDP